MFELRSTLYCFPYYHVILGQMLLNIAAITVEKFKQISATQHTVVLYRSVEK